MRNTTLKVGIILPALSDKRIRRRLKYVCDFIEGRCSTIQFALLQDYNENGTDFIIEYSPEKAYKADLFIFYSSSLDKNHIAHSFNGKGRKTRLFASGENFDFFAAIFHCLLRTEEYMDEDRDVHGRFKPENSWMYEADCLQYPIVDVWVDEFLNKLEVKLGFKCAYHWQLIASCDIDYAWKYQYLKPRSYIKRLVKSIATLNFSAARALLLGDRDDPYYVFDRYSEILEKQDVKALFFILLSGSTVFDIQNKIIDNSAFRELVNKLKGGHIIGIHPSYNAGYNLEILENELSIYENIVGEEAIHSRQHYLRISYPETIKHLNESGIKHDYTMGYASVTGWRSGTSYPYNWYDMDKEKSLKIKIHPLQFMDATMTSYQDKTPEEAGQIIAELRGEIRKYGGEFGILWHNSFFEGKDPKWWKIFDESLRQ